MAEDITQRIVEVIAKTVHQPVDAFTPESTFESLGIDSLDGIQILFALEQEFDISIPDEEAKKIRGIADIKAFIAARK